MERLRERLRNEEGFTLIELMVVVLIIGVLVAIAIPSFLGFRSRAQDRAAQAELRNVLLAEKAYWTENGDYTTTESALRSYMPGIRIDAKTSLSKLTSTTPVRVVVVGSAKDGVCLVKVSGSGNKFAIWDDATAGGGTYYRAWASNKTPSCPTATGSAPSGWSTTAFPSP